jgi:hypothetical protein
MKLPFGMSTSSPNDVWKLNHSLYCSKQAPRAWFEKFQTNILSFSFIQSQYNSSFFLQKTPNEIVVLYIYIDDIIVTGYDMVTISKIKKLLNIFFI